MGCCKGSKKKSKPSIYKNAYNETTKKSVFSFYKDYIFKWKKSVFKLIWTEMLFFIGSYSALAFFYEFVLFNHVGFRQFFELLCIAAHNELELVPIALMLGFYVRQVVNRWWDQFMALPRPDRFALKLVGIIPPKVSQILDAKIKH